MSPPPYGPGVSSWGTSNERNSLIALAMWSYKCSSLWFGVSRKICRSVFPGNVLHDDIHHGFSRRIIICKNAVNLRDSDAFSFWLRYPLESSESKIMGSRFGVSAFRPEGESRNESEGNFWALNSGTEVEDGDRAEDEGEKEEADVEVEVEKEQRSWWLRWDEPKGGL